MKQFWKLSSNRSIGMSVGPIWSTAIWAFCDRFGFDEDESDDFELIIQTLDEKFIAWLSDEQSGAKNKPPAQKPEKK